MYTYVYVHMYIHMYAYVYIQTYIHIYIYIFIHIYMYIHTLFKDVSRHINTRSTYVYVSSKHAHDRMSHITQHLIGQTLHVTCLIRIHLS